MGIPFLPTNNTPPHDYKVQPHLCCTLFWENCCRAQHRAGQPHSHYLKTLLYFIVAGFYLQLIKETPFLRPQQDSAFPLGNKKRLVLLLSGLCKQKSKRLQTWFPREKNQGRIKDSILGFFFLLLICHF